METPGRQGGPYAAGPGGYCVCPDCGHRQEHAAGTPCTEQKCSECDALMTREGVTTKSLGAWFDGWAVQR